MVMWVIYMRFDFHATAFLLEISPVHPVHAPCIFQVTFNGMMMGRVVRTAPIFRLDPDAMSLLYCALQLFPIVTPIIQTYTGGRFT